MIKMSFASTESINHIVSYFGCNNIRKSVIIAAILFFLIYFTLCLIKTFT